MRIPRPTSLIAGLDMRRPIFTAHRNAVLHIASVCAFFGCRHHPLLADRSGIIPTQEEKAAHHRRTRETVRTYVRMIRSELEVAS